MKQLFDPNNSHCYNFGCNVLMTVHIFWFGDFKLPFSLKFPFVLLALELLTISVLAITHCQCEKS
jgi:hypothetical protein